MHFVFWGGETRDCDFADVWCVGGRNSVHRSGDGNDGLIAPSDDEELPDAEDEDEDDANTNTNMKIDRSRLRKSSSEVPAECQALIDRLCACSRDELLDELSKINTWTFGKCELYHWTTVLDIFDDILEEAATTEEDTKWALNCDIHYNQRVRTIFIFPPVWSLRGWPLGGHRQSWRINSRELRRVERRLLFDCLINGQRWWK